VAGECSGAVPVNGGGVARRYSRVVNLRGYFDCARSNSAFGRRGRQLL